MPKATVDEYHCAEPPENNIWPPGQCPILEPISVPRSIQTLPNKNFDFCVFCTDRRHDSRPRLTVDPVCHYSAAPKNCGTWYPTPAKQGFREMGKKSIEVIDLFAGPGGLAEGFSAFGDRTGHRPFNIGISVEKDAAAHRTLELRSFFRSFGDEVPNAYYEYLRGEITRERLFNRFPLHAEIAQAETLNGPRELGKRSDDQEIFRAIRQNLRSTRDDTVVIGGPPCQAYSIVGRARAKGIAGYRPEKDHRHFLYRDYLRILAMASPAVFVMENVKGILSSQVNGSNIFPRILEDLTHPGKALRKDPGPRYKIYSLVERQPELCNLADGNYIIASEHYGIPQTRHRVILLGVREDLKKVPAILRPANRMFTVADSIRDLPMVRSGLTRERDSAEAWHEYIRQYSKSVSKELRSLGFVGGSARKAARGAARLSSIGGRFVKAEQESIRIPQLNRWFVDRKIGGYINHESRSHMPSDLERYLFCVCYAKQNGGNSPRAHEIPRKLAPKHENWNSGDFVDRFKVQSANRPSSTITSHVSKDGHYFIHYDPAQCRSLTVREAARLQTFPDNYFFEGNRTEQYTQVGNAVPPLLARQIAHVVWGLLV